MRVPALIMCVFAGLLGMTAYFALKLDRPNRTFESELHRHGVREPIMAERSNYSNNTMAVCIVGGLRTFELSCMQQQFYERFAAEFVTHADFFFVLNTLDSISGIDNASGAVTKIMLNRMNAQGIVWMSGLEVDSWIASLNLHNRTCPIDQNIIGEPDHPVLPQAFNNRVCGDIISQAEITRKRKYEWALRVRPDIEFHAAIPSFSSWHAPTDDPYGTFWAPRFCINGKAASAADFINVAHGSNAIYAMFNGMYDGVQNCELPNLAEHNYTDPVFSSPEQVFGAAIELSNVTRRLLEFVMVSVNRNFKKCNIDHVYSAQYKPGELYSSALALAPRDTMGCVGNWWSIPAKR